MKPIYSLPLVQLIESVVSEKNTLALHEFHANRTVFQWNSRWLCLADYLNEIRKQAWNHNCEVAECAYDLTLDKFHNIPEQNNSSQLKPKGPDCRLYYKAYLNHVLELQSKIKGLNALEEEKMAARVLQKFVTWHFHLSVLECRRKMNEGVSRYDWQVNGKTFRLWFPKHFNGHNRRQWLEANIDHPDPSQSNEQERIQNHIDQQLQVNRSLSYEDNIYSHTQSENDHEYMRSVAQKLNVDGVAKTIAQEKIENIRHIRPAVRALGTDTLKQLILEIFDSICSDSFDAAQIAHKYGLSKSTLSRFAGSQWDLQDDATSSIPDLWQNTAQVFAHHPVYREAAMECGLWKQIIQCLQMVETQENSS